MKQIRRIFSIHNNTQGKIFSLLTPNRSNSVNRPQYIIQLCSILIIQDFLGPELGSSRSEGSDTNN